MKLKTNKSIRARFHLHCVEESFASIQVNLCALCVFALK
jgi:hypothetical protein